MKRTVWFARRNLLEIVRDPISVFFGICFPIVLLLLLTLIDRAIPAEAQMTLYHIENLAPGIAAFSLCFLCLFSSMTVSKDRAGNFLLRLLTTPMTAVDFIAGYCLPMLPLGLAQAAVCYLAAIPLGLPVTSALPAAVLALLPAALLYTCLGLLLGTLLSEKAVGGICGALVTNLAGWLSGTWFSLEMIGGKFEAICKLLPFYPCVLASRHVLAGDFRAALPYLGNVCIWAVGTFAAAVCVFLHKMHKNDR